jgi:cysteine desulfurase family protein
MIYLDHAATTLGKPPEVARAMTQALEQMGNAGRGAHAPTLQASRTIYETRALLAELFHVPDPAQIAFTSNVTEALNTAIGGLISPGDHVITTMCEHNSVLRPLYRKEKEGAQLTFLETDALGRIDYDGLERSRRSNTRAVVLTHASNVTGNVTDLERVSAFTKQYGILLIVDAAQSAGAIPIDVQQLGIDVLCFTGHKALLGPQGTGGLCVRAGLSIAPLKAGGSGVHSYEHEHPSMMPTALEAGTLNGPGIAGLGAALSYLKREGMEHLYQREMQLARRFYEGVKDLPGLQFYGDYESEARTAVVSLNLRDLDAGQVSDWLWEDYEICVRAGAHCAPLMHQAFGTVEQGIVRFSFSHSNTEAEVDTAIQAVRELAE